MARNLDSITVRELIEILQQEDPDAKVIFGADYGDYHHTMQALPINGRIEEVEVVTEDGYSNSGFAIVDEDDRDEDDEDDEPQTFLRIL